MNEHVKHWIDTIAFGSVVANALEWLPNISLLLSIIWFLIRIYESRTVQNLLKKWT